ncbi:hypothetical protein [Candidatus Entotheonella palauensis]|uniref:Uncharacterized protein n=1 Tax=Candidatus Entotheonella gemina TaxID=1429439 RepID=W4LXC1_9BACT|nr:hypothetical protein [Candidatus Entotheonella palauensis]ETX02386.1 MAG: hypothetical protein ETSY2_35660 [Candidatus Entotheonella gemina]
MVPKELKTMVDLVTAAVTDRLCAQGLLMRSDVERQEQLRADIDVLSERDSLRNEVIAQVRAEIAEHGFLTSKGRHSGGSDSGNPEADELRPPDFGPDGPSDDDIQREIDDLMRKLQRLRNPQPPPAPRPEVGHDAPSDEPRDEYPKKKPGHVQIDVGLLISIILELLMLILKLRERLKRLEGQWQNGG